jgi:glycosyltransferase involved in cell wall biosynthesis
MRLDVLIPTHNRAALLGRALDSLLAADRPDGLTVEITVIDNRSTDYTPELVESFTPRSGGHVHYLYESQPGRSHALNAGIAATTGDLVGMIDDDEEVDCGWLRTIAAAFEDVTTDFIGGPYLPRWGGKRPAWVGAGYLAAIGWAESGQATQQFGPGFDGMLMGGNAVIRRTVLERAGPYCVDLGRTPGTRLMSCEDEDMFTRLLAIRARGFYRPDLVIHHYVPPERLTKGYFRRWCFWHGVSQGVLHRRRPAMVPYVLGIPRYMIGVAVRGTIKMVRSVFGPSDPARVFKNELDWWEVGGFFYGKHVYRISAVRQQAGSRVEAEEAALDETRGSIRGSVAKSERRRSSRLTANETPQPGPVKTPLVAPDRQA